MKSRQSFNIHNLGGVAEIPEIVGSEIREPLDDRPWVFTNMVSTLDGAAVIDGTSGALSSPADRTMFRSLRAQADVILVGAGTARAEQYRLPLQPSEELAEQRAARGQDPRIALIVVSRSPDGTGIPAATEGQSSSSDTLLTCGVPRFSIAAPTGGSFTPLLQELRAAGAQRVLCEGGPNLLGQLHAQALIDEWNFSIAPAVVGGPEPRPVHSQSMRHDRLELARLVVGQDGTLLGRYLSSTTPAPN